MFKRKARIMELIHKVVVGSRLHGLSNENSDYDYRGIFKHDLKSRLSPFKKLKNTHWIEGDEDNTTYELGEFCKFASKGNPTILEILWSNQVIETSTVGKILVENRHKFLNSEDIYNSHVGYAHNQYTKMKLFTPDERTPKFAVAYIRSLLQGIDLLKHGDFCPQVSKEWQEYLLTVKYDWHVDLVPELSQRFRQLQSDILEARIQNLNKYKPDIEWIEDLVYSSYMNQI